MEPENKKEIRIGWWKFVGVQASVVVLVCLVFVAAQMYPQEIKNDYRSKRNTWKKTKERYVLAASKMANVDQILRKAIDSAQQITPGERDMVEKQCAEFEQDFMKSEKKPASKRIPNMYQLVVRQYLSTTDKLKAASGDGCPKELAAANDKIDGLRKDNDALRDQKTELQDKYDTYKTNHP